MGLQKHVWTNYFYDALLIDEDDNRSDLQPETPLTPESENTIVDSLDDVIPEPQLLPAWIKTNAKFWSQDQIDDATFTLGLQYLIDEKIIKLSDELYSSTDEQVSDSLNE